MTHTPYPAQSFKVLFQTSHLSFYEIEKHIITPLVFLQTPLRGLSELASAHKEQKTMKATLSCNTSKFLIHTFNSEHIVKILMSVRNIDRNQAHHYKIFFFQQLNWVDHYV